MSAYESIDPVKVKRASERLLLAAGAGICDWLPHIDETTARPIDAIARRALILNAMIALAYKAPPLFIRDWLVSNDLESDLAASERFIVASPGDAIPEQKLMELSWSMEALWTLMWVCGRVPELSFDDPIGNELAGMFPNLQANEAAEAFYGTLERRSYAEMYAMRDLMYRAHWYARDGELNGYPTPEVDHDVIMERRKAMEWVMDAQADWDNTEQGT